MINVTNETFDEVVLKSEKPVLFTIGAPWCIDCRRAQPFLETFEKVFGDRVLFVHADVDESPELKKRLEVGHIPTMIIFKGGVASEERLVEVKLPSELRAFIEKALA